MNSKTILGISLAAVFAVSMIFAPNVTAAGSHLDIKKVKLDVDDGFAKVEIKTNGNIPVGVGAFGYGIITAFNGDGAPENVLALTSHVCAADSFNQGDTINELTACPFSPQGSIGVLEVLRDAFGFPFPAGEIDQANDGGLMHPHILDLTGYSDACKDATGMDEGVEVDVARTIGTFNNISPGDYDLKVGNKKISVKDIPIDAKNLMASDLLAYASFNIMPLEDGAGHITNLCLTDLTLTLADSDDDDERDHGDKKHGDKKHDGKKKHGDDKHRDKKHK